MTTFEVQYKDYDRESGDDLGMGWALIEGVSLADAMAALLEQAECEDVRRVLVSVNGSEARS